LLLGAVCGCKWVDYNKGVRHCSVIALTARPIVCMSYTSPSAHLSLSAIYSAPHAFTGPPQRTVALTKHRRRPSLMLMHAVSVHCAVPCGDIVALD